jgi:NADH:ubiquinone oxidoreductase subunit F (NADH-binding)
LIDILKAAGLTGRGGAAFPVYRKWAIMAEAKGPKVIVANGAEGEPAAHKDALLLRVAPNLVLDGLQLAAEAVGATEVHLCVHRGNDYSELRKAVAQRAQAGLDPLHVKISEVPQRFLAGQESSLVHWLGGGPAIPTLTPPRVTESGLGGAPTLVQNVETLAHVALIARYGPKWFRELGTEEEPGSMLASVTTQQGKQVGYQVKEAAIGAPLRTLIGPENLEGAQAVLLGGYHGTWLPADLAATLTMDNKTLKALEPHSAAVGAGVIAVLPDDRCGLVETALVARYLAAESAGQCGPCFKGLPAIANGLAELALRGDRDQVRARLERWAGMVKGRGLLCSHPDGTMRFVTSALTVFAPEINLHSQGYCSVPLQSSRTPFLPVPPPTDAPKNEKDWR